MGSVKIKALLVSLKVVVESHPHSSFFWRVRMAGQWGVGQAVVEFVRPGLLSHLAGQSKTFVVA